MSIEVTDNAFKRVSELIEIANEPSLVLRISVDGGGCSGFMYNYELIQNVTITDDDYIIKQDDTAIVIDSVSKEFMKDCIVDFITTLGSSYFEIRNPNAKAKCGCGNSFAL